MVPVVERVAGVALAWPRVRQVAQPARAQQPQAHVVPRAVERAGRGRELGDARVHRAQPRDRGPGKLGVDFESRPGQFRLR